MTFRLISAVCFLLLIGSVQAWGQSPIFSQADTLRGMLRPERTCYDIKFYDLNISVNPTTRSISGSNTIVYKVVRGFNMLQIDLFENMQIDSILHKSRSVIFHRKHNAVFVDLGEMQEEDILDTIVVHYQGVPRAAIRAPWDGGFTWKKDKNGKEWIAVSCEGVGASLWFPNKDHLSDEPDSMRIRCTVPAGLTCISNGVMRAKLENKPPKPTKKNKKAPKVAPTTTFDWFVSYPINNYNVTLYIGDYVHFSDTFVSPFDSSKLPLDYYVLPYNLEKAKKQFKETHQTLFVMEKYLDKYPFFNDGFALVEAPYLGMEHQSAIAYGNGFLPGYMGSHPDGIPFDYIIMHESAHEWWGNSITCTDHAELWIHESFTTYMESVYVEETYGEAALDKYLRYQRTNMSHSQPIIGPKDVNFTGHNNDIYYKGACMLHTLRNSLGDDAKWWKLLKTFYQKNKISNVRSEDFIAFVNEFAGSEGETYDSFFQQYLRSRRIPTVQYRLRLSEKQLKVELKLQSEEVPDLAFPVGYTIKGTSGAIRLNTKTWTTLTFDDAQLSDFKLKFGLYNESKLP
jgi:aminopeptidase N